MTTAPERPAIRRPANPPRAGRTGGQPPWSLWAYGDLCGYCAGHQAVWCPYCGGFDSSRCYPCRRVGKVPCPACAGGRLEKWSPR